MITVVIVDSTIAGGRVVTPGETVEMSEQEAELLVSMGRAKLVERVIEEIVADEILANPLAVRETTMCKPPEKRRR